MVTVADRWIAEWSWIHWALKHYADQGSFQDAVVKMFWVSLLKFYLFLILLHNFNSLLLAKTFSFGGRR
jgi:hypothetical protein